jgi:hypothetical protein
LIRLRHPAVSLFLRCLWATSFPSSGAVPLHAPFSGRMVLQRDSPLRLCGVTEPRERAAVRSRCSARSAIADPQGKWQLFTMALHSIPINDPHTVAAKFAPSLFGAPGNVDFMQEANWILSRPVVGSIETALQRCGGP